MITPFLAPTEPMTNKLLEQQLSVITLLNQLQQRFVEQSFNEKQLQALETSLKEAIDLCQQEVAERPLAHFDFAIAKQNPKAILPYSPVSGSFNPIAPAINIDYDVSSKQIRSEVVCTRIHEGPPNMVHGGVISAIFDQLLAMCATCNDLAGPTATLTIDYLAPTPLNEPLEFTCQIDRVEEKKVFVTGLCHCNDKLVTKASGLFIRYLPK